MQSICWEPTVKLPVERNYRWDHSLNDFGVVWFGRLVYAHNLKTGQSNGRLMLAKCRGSGLPLHFAMQTHFFWPLDNWLVSCLKWLKSYADSFAFKEASTVTAINEFTLLGELEINDLSYVMIMVYINDDHTNYSNDACVAGSDRWIQFNSGLTPGQNAS